MSPLWPLAHPHWRPCGAACSLQMRPTTTPFSSTSQSSSLHWPDERLAEARLRTRDLVVIRILNSATAAASSTYIIIGAYARKGWQVITDAGWGARIGWQPTAEAG